MQLSQISACALRLFGLTQSANRFLRESLGRFDDQGKGNSVTALADQDGKFGRSHAHDDRHIHLPGVQGDLQVHGIDLGDRDDQCSAFESSKFECFPVRGIGDDGVVSGEQMCIRDRSLRN